MSESWSSVAPTLSAAVPATRTERRQMRRAEGDLFLHAAEPLLQGDARPGDVSLRPERWGRQSGANRGSGAAAQARRRVRSRGGTLALQTTYRDAVPWPEHIRAIRQREWRHGSGHRIE